MEDDNAFYLFLVVEKGLSKNTAKAYNQDLLLFEKLTNSKPSSVNEQSFQQFLEALRKKNYADSSIARMVVSLRMYRKFLSIVNEGNEKDEVVLEAPKSTSYVPAVLSEAEVALLLTSKEDTYIQVVIELIYACGLRVSEAISLNCIDIGTDTLLVKGKGEKERVVPIAKRTKDRINNYLLLEKRGKEKKEPLFVNSRGKRLSRQEVWSAMKVLAKKLKITKNVSPHILRHSYATHMLERGANLRVIQELLGHSSITTTERYTHISKKKLKESFSKFHPLID